MRFKTALYSWWLGVNKSSAFNDIAGWWRADKTTGSANSYTLVDQSTGGHNMVQQAGTTATGSGTNGQTKITCSGSARFDSSPTLAINNFPGTIIVVVKRTSAVACGFFGRSDFATHTTDIWFGFENDAGSGNEKMFTYGANSTQNQVSDINTTNVYVSRAGYGTRGQIFNGILQSVNTLSGQPQQSSPTASIGTNYRSLNGLEWYETLYWNRTLTWDEIDEVHTYLNTRYALSIPLWSSYTPVITVAKCGQSNASGRWVRGASDVNVPAIYKGAITGCSIYEVSLSYPQTLNIQVPNNMYNDGEAGTYMGNECPLAYQYILRTGNNLHMFKMAHGGTSLGNTATLNSWWCPTIQNLNQGADHLNYNNFMLGWWKVLVYMQANSLRPNIRMIDWWQGEDDATVQAAANAYQTNLISFINEFRKEMGFSASKTPFYITRLPSWQQGGETYLSTVRAAQAAVSSSISNCFMIDSDSYTSNGTGGVGDNVHIDGTSQIADGTAKSLLI